MIKIVLCSDSHGHMKVLQDLANKHHDADYYWHLGDSECFDVEEIKPFISVMGNVDINFDLPDMRLFTLNNHNILLIHGNGHLNDLEMLADYGKKLNCDVVLYGHTHRPNDCVVNGIRLINPGSCHNNRNGLCPTYCLLFIDDDGNISADYFEIDK